MRGISWLAGNQLAAQEGLWTMEWVSKELRAALSLFRGCGYYPDSAQPPKLCIIFTKTQERNTLWTRTNAFQNFIRRLSGTDTPTLTQQLRSRWPGASRILWNSDLITHAWPSAYVHTMESSWNPNKNTPDPYRPQRDHPVACVIAQQYSSAYFIHCVFILARIISAFVWRTSLFHFVAFFSITAKVCNWINLGLSVVRWINNSLSIQTTVWIRYVDIVESYWQGRTRILRKEPVPVSLYAPQIPSVLRWTREKAATNHANRKQILFHNTVHILILSSKTRPTFSLHRLSG